MVEDLKHLIESTKDEDSEAYKIMSELLDTDKNLESKTEISKPYHFATAQTISDYFKDNKLIKSAEILEIFCIKFMKILISKNRKGRAEIIQGLKSLANSISLSDENDKNNPLKRGL